MVPAASQRLNIVATLSSTSSSQIQQIKIMPRKINISTRLNYRENVQKCSGLCNKLMPLNNFHNSQICISDLQIYKRFYCTNDFVK